MKYFLTTDNILKIKECHLILFEIWKVNFIRFIQLKYIPLNVDITVISCV